MISIIVNETDKIALHYYYIVLEFKQVDILISKNQALQILYFKHMHIKLHG